MRRKFLHAIVAFFPLLAVGACDLSPEIELSMTLEDVTTTYNNTMARATAVYMYLPNGLSYVGGDAMLASACDEAEHTNEGNSVQMFNTGSWSQLSNPDDAWTRCFNGIYAALNQMDAEIRHSDQLKNETERARQEWIANITHDLKTPLSPVKGYAELLACGTASDSQTVQEYGSIILKNADHVEKLINDLKLTYQLESGALPFHPQPVRLVRYLKELVIDIANDPAFSNRNIEFECDLPEITATIDPDLFHRAVCNLVVNALVHNPPDTTVTVSVIEDKEKGVCLSVRDNGVGISETEQAKLFTRYYRGTNTKEKSEGSGLGLAIAKQIVVLHNGEITVKSEPGKGTVFSIVLPTN